MDKKSIYEGNDTKRADDFMRLYQNITISKHNLENPIARTGDLVSYSTTTIKHILDDLALTLKLINEWEHE